MNPIIINVNGVMSVPMELKVFNGGEVNVCVPDRKYPPNVETVVITVQLSNAEDLMALVNTVDAVRRRFPAIATLMLSMAYAPYARQDRVCNKGEALTSKVFANIINSLEFNVVEVYDPHSDVMPALLNNCHVMTMTDIISQTGLAEVIIRGDLTLVSPDAGSVKKVEDLAKRMGVEDIVYGTKHRDLKSGELSGFGYHTQAEIRGKDVLIVDDICDGGGTFVGLAKELTQMGGARSVSLYVTHGIFSRGVDHLLDNGIENIWTTNSIPQVEHKNLTILNLA